MVYPLYSCFSQEVGRLVAGGDESSTDVGGGGQCMCLAAYMHHLRAELDDALEIELGYPMLRPGKILLYTSFFRVQNYTDLMPWNKSHS